jgi:hypothetical protein
MELPPDWSEFIGCLCTHNKTASGRPKDLADVALLNEGRD